jgi:hypothetical protein
MSLFSFTYRHPHTGQSCTVDSGKPTQMLAFIDILRYMRRIGLRKEAPKSALHIRDETLRTVRSSHGQLRIDPAGNVIYREIDNPEPDCGGHLAAITRFDVGEWRRYWGGPLPAVFDILDLGYWYTKPETGETDYAAPVADWRKNIAETLLQRTANGGHHG